MAAVLPNTTERPGSLMTHFPGRLSELPLLTNGDESGKRKQSSPYKLPLIESLHVVSILVFAVDV